MDDTQTRLRMRVEFEGCDFSCVYTVAPKVISGEAASKTVRVEVLTIADDSGLEWADK